MVASWYTTTTTENVKHIRLHEWTEIKPAAIGVLYSTRFLFQEGDYEAHKTIHEGNLLGSNLSIALLRPSTKSLPPIMFLTLFPSRMHVPVTPEESETMFSISCPSRLACVHKRRGTEVNEIREEKTRSWPFHSIGLSVCIIDHSLVCKILVSFARINVCKSPSKLYFCSVFFVFVCRFTRPVRRHEEEDSRDTRAHRVNSS